MACGTVPSRSNGAVPLGPNSATTSTPWMYVNMPKCTTKNGMRNSLPAPVRRFARLGEEQSGHVEPTHHDVLQPVQQHQGEHRPAEQQDTRDWESVRQEEDQQG